MSKMAGRRSSDRDDQNSPEAQSRALSELGATLDTVRRNNEGRAKSSEWPWPFTPRVKLRRSDKASGRPKKPSVQKQMAEEPVADDGRVADAAAPKPYVSIAELAKLTPWTQQAIRTMISRGVFVEGKHYYHVGRRPVFKWREVCHFIHDGLPAPAESEAPIPHYRDKRKR